MKFVHGDNITCHFQMKSKLTEKSFLYYKESQTSWVG